MIGSLAPCVVLYDEALGYGWIVEPRPPAALLEGWVVALGAASRRLQHETGEDPALWLPALHDARRAVDAMTGPEVHDALVACEEGA